MSYQDQIKNIQLEQLKAMQFDKMKKTNIEEYDIYSETEQKKEQLREK